MSDKFVRFNDPEAAQMLPIIAKNQKRDEGDQVAWLIRQEYARLFSQPNPLITIADAEKAAATAQA